MTAMNNKQVVKDAFAAFGRGDVPGVLATLADDIEWEAVIGTEGVVPTAGLRRGRDAVGGFFQQLGESVEFALFEPREFIAEDDQVAVVGHYQGRAKSTGKGFDSDWVMIFNMRDGKVVKFRRYCDSREVRPHFNSGGRHCDRADITRTMCSGLQREQQTPEARRDRLLTKHV